MSRYIDLDKAIPIAIQAVVDVVGHGISQVDAVDIALKFEDAATTDVVEVRHGKWLPTNIPTIFSGVIHECSLCKAKDGEHSSILGYYCWRCGAKMDGRREENEHIH